MRRPLPFALVFLLAMSSCVEPVPSSPFGINQQQSSLRPEAPHLRRLSNGHYRVRKPWVVHLHGRSFRVPKGYTSNGITASPSIKATLGDGVQYRETWAAVFHDWLFTQPGMSRTEADRLFYSLLRAYEVPETKARLMYASVSAYSSRKQGY